MRALLLLLLLPASALADSLTAYVTIFTAPQSWEPQIHTTLEATATLESASGPFYEPWFQAMVPQERGYVITSLSGMLDGEPVSLMDGRSWVQAMELGRYRLGYIGFISEGREYRAFSEVTRFVLTGLPTYSGGMTAGGVGFAAPTPFTALAVPEASSALLLLIGFGTLCVRRSQI